MNRACLIFCITSLLVSLGLMVALYPLSAIPLERLSAARTPVPAEKLPDLDLGEFGTVSVSELVGYYIENPPTGAALEALTQKSHFQGC